MFLRLKGKCLEVESPAPTTAAIFRKFLLLNLLTTIVFIFNHKIWTNECKVYGGHVDFSLAPPKV